MPPALLLLRSDKIQTTELEVPLQQQPQQQQRRPWTPVDLPNDNGQIKRTRLGSNTSTIYSFSKQPTSIKMMVREAPIAPPGIHNNNLSSTNVTTYDEQHWQQPAKSNATSQGWWAGPGGPQAGFNGMVSSPTAMPGYNHQPIFFNEPHSHFSPFGGPNLRSNSFPLSPEGYASPNHRTASQPQTSYFAAAPNHHHNTFLHHHHQQHQHQHQPHQHQPQHFGHEQHQQHSLHSMHPMHGFQGPMYNKQPISIKTPFAHTAMSPWPPVLKQQPMLHHINIHTGGRPKMISPTRMSNGQISPVSLGGAHSHPHSIQRHDSVIDTSAPRGPPRKPRQSGFALWVGNLPYGAQIVALKDHFSRDARDDIESLCLLATSSCAFVNYRSEESVIAAHQRFNGSQFGPVRLLCRVRNGKDQKLSGRASPPSTNLLTDGEKSEEVNASTGAVEDMADDLAGVRITSDATTAAVDETSVSPTCTSTTSALAKQQQPLARSTKPTDRYFIVKSLTESDLRVSLQNGTWETQPHNRERLDAAFDSAENVFLIFSVNKSGEYFGYARMASRSFEHHPTSAAAAGGTTSHRNSNSGSPGHAGLNNTTTSSTTAAEIVEVDHNAGLIITPTDATDTAPKGQIVEDAYRGTLFWEADRDDAAASSSSSGSGSGSAGGEAEGKVAKEEETGSRRFRVEWLSKQVVSFRRTKGMRNPWNDNKEVKVARDGTELETEVGRCMLALFNGPSGLGAGGSVEGLGRR